MLRKIKILKRVCLAAGATVIVTLAGCSPTADTASNVDSELSARRLALLEEENQRLRNFLQEYEAEKSHATDAAARTEIELAVSQLRGLPFLQPVSYRTMPKEDLPKLLEQKIAEQYSDEGLQLLSEAYAVLGFVPHGLDIKSVYLDLFSEQVAAFYDQHAGELFMFAGKSLDNAENRIILAHELTHALQDQHYTLANLPLEIQDNDDVRIAVTSVLEGDATVLMSLFMLQDMRPGSIRQVVMSMLGEEIEQLMNAPRFIREGLLFPYLKGQEFVTAVMAESGFDAVDEVYDRLPVSTLEILEPSVYLEGGFRPVTVFNFTEQFADQEIILENTLGAFGIQLLRDEWLPEEKSARPWDGWQGDRYRVYKGQDGLILESHSTWRDAATADAFVELATRIWNARGEKARNVKIEKKGSIEVIITDLPEVR